MKPNSHAAWLAGCVVAVLAAVGLAAHNRSLAGRLLAAQKTLEETRAAPRDAVREADGQLRHRLNEAERELAVLRRRVSSPAEAAAAPHAAGAGDEVAPVPPARRERNLSPDAFFARMREEQPERYEEWTRRMAEGRRRATDTLAHQTSFALSLDTDAMTPAQKENHDALLDVLRDIWDLNSRVDDAPEGTDAAAWRRALRDLARDLRPLLEIQRETALQQVGLDLGYDRAGAEIFSAEILHVMEMTSPAAYWRGRRDGVPMRGRGDEER